MAGDSKYFAHYYMHDDLVLLKAPRWRIARPCVPCIVDGQLAFSCSSLAWSIIHALLGRLVRGRIRRSLRMGIARGRRLLTLPRDRISSVRLVSSGEKAIVIDVEGEGHYVIRGVGDRAGVSMDRLATELARRGLMRG